MAANGSVYVWRVSTGAELMQTRRYRGLLFVPMAFAPDNKTLATPDVKDQVIRLWNTDTGAEVNPP
jgi:WD40 repeat protein